MARIELRHATIMIQDGLSGSARLSDDVVSANDTDTDVTLVALNTDETDLVPVGARFTFDADTRVYTVTSRTPAGAGPTTNIEFTPAFAAPLPYAAVAADATLTCNQGNLVLTADDPGPDYNSYVWELSDAGADELTFNATTNTFTLEYDGGNSTFTDLVNEVTANMTANPTWPQFTATTGDGANAVEAGDDGVNATTANGAWGSTLHFLPSRIEVKVGEGNLTWSEAKEYEYLLDRGDLDTVKEGDEQPLELSLEFVYEYVLTGTGETITPVDAVKGSGGAAEWVSSSSDPCEPYAVDLIVLHCVPCGGDEDERIEFPDFRYESLEFDLGEATISVSGRCNASEPSITRSNDSECA